MIRNDKELAIMIYDITYQNGLADLQLILDVWGLGMAVC